MAEMEKVSFLLDENLKKRIKRLCEEDLGITMTRAFTIFAEKVAEVKCIPFTLKSDTKPNDKENAEMGANTAKTE